MLYDLPPSVVADVVKTLEPLMFMSAFEASTSSGSPLYIGAKLMVSHLLVPVLSAALSLSHAAFTVSLLMLKSKLLSKLKRSKVNVSPSVSVVKD